WTVDSLETRRSGNRGRRRKRPAKAPRPPPPPPDEPLVTNAPPVPAVARFAFTDEQRAQLKEITRLGMKLGGWNGLTPAEREETQKQLQSVQKAFDLSMKASHAEFAKKVEAEQKEREEAREEEQQKRREAAEGRQRMIE